MRYEIKTEDHTWISDDHTCSDAAVSCYLIWVQRGSAQEFRQE